MVSKIVLFRFLSIDKLFSTLLGDRSIADYGTNIFQENCIKEIFQDEVLEMDYSHGKG